ncbi:hypothetical protein VTO73DRAFT_11145 [Trametes versicolor]
MLLQSRPRRWECFDAHADVETRDPWARLSRGIIMAREELMLQLKQQRIKYRRIFAASFVRGPSCKLHTTYLSMQCHLDRCSSTEVDGSMDDGDIWTTRCEKNIVHPFKFDPTTVLGIPVPPPQISGTPRPYPHAGAVYVDAYSSLRRWITAPRRLSVLEAAPCWTPAA